ncbi:hypothetical protein ACIBI6_37260, partial [Nocardia sp. NPDC050412]
MPLAIPGQSSVSSPVDPTDAAAGANPAAGPGSAAGSAAAGSAAVGVTGLLSALLGTGSAGVATILGTGSAAVGSAAAG